MLVPGSPRERARADRGHVNIVRLLQDDPVLADLARHVAGGRRIFAQGVQGSSAVFTAAALAERLRRPILLVVAHLDDADEALEELLAAGVDAVRFPALELAPGESGVSIELFGERLGVLRRVLTLGEGAAPVVIAPVQALM